MSSTAISLAKIRAAMCAADFNFANCGAVSAIPAFLSSLNASFTRASVKNVLQDRSAVGRTNLCAYSKADQSFVQGGGTPPVITHGNTCLGVSCTSATFTSAMTAGYANSRIYGSAIKGTVTNGSDYTASAYISLSRALVGAETIIYYWTGARGSNLITLNAANSAAYVGAWVRQQVTVNANSTGDEYPVVYLGTSVATDVTVHVSRTQLELGIVTATEWIRTDSVPITIYDTPSATPSLLPLTTNQFGTSKDPSNGLYGALIEGAATNLALYSEGDVSNWGAVGVTNAASTFFGATNAFYFVNNAIADRSIKQALSITSGTTYTISAYVIMDDLSTPVVGTTVSTGDFCIVGDATVITSPALVESCGGNIYRVSASITAGVTGNRLFGFYKESTHSVKGFRLTKIQIETGILSSYIATTSATVTRAAEKLFVPLWKNNLKYSTDPTGTGWSRANVTLTGGQSDSSGGTTAYKVEATATAATSLVQNTIVAPATTVTYSLKVKAGSGPTTLNFILRNGTTSTNFTTGVFITATGAIFGAGWTSVASGNGYYKLTFTTASGISVGDTLYFYIGYTGNSITAGYYFYYDSPQLEVGSTATTYVPTTSTLDVTGNANIPGFSSAGYTLAADFRSMAARTSSAGLIDINDNTASNRSNMVITAGDLFNPNSVTGGVSQANIIGSACTNIRRKGAASFQTNNFMAANNGVALTADTSGTMPIGLLLLNLGTVVTGSTPFNGYTYRLQLITKALTQSQLNGLTQ